ncbi:hypothetical protein SLS62_008702 [Diatrype stigma]|uniref:DUF7492 domain-containing protein n=1 Tax=Diatrype stigma TaxID=117547 RepID=A0AAN9UR67_9PEZI
MVSSKSIYTAATTTGLLLAGLQQGARAHSWVETLRLIAPDGTFTGEPGYPIGYVDRNQPGFSDPVAQNQILNKAGNPAVCKPLAGAYQTYTRLGAAPGDWVAMLYQENGHVTDPTQTVRPFRGGNVYVYGTLEHQDSDGINDVLGAWTADGTGGNGKGRLLASHYYDDGICYQNRATTSTTTTFPVYTERHEKYKADEVACQSDFQLPADLPASGKYTVMWVWDWPRIETDTTNVTEIYTSCAEIDLGAASDGSKVANVKNSIHFASPDTNKVGSGAIPSQVQTLIEATALGVGTASPAPVTLAQSDAKPGDATDAPAQPTPSPSVPVSVTTTTAHKNKGGKNNGIQTVTVTAEPETTTHYHTVTVGGDGSQATASPSAPASQASVTSVEPFISQPTASQAAPTTTPNKPAPASSSQAAPTSQAGAPSVEPFMKMVRATGAARRSASSSWALY